MKWIHQFKEEFQWYLIHSHIAVVYGDLDILKWMKTKGCPWDSYTFQSAGKFCDGNNLEVLEWLRINDCPWNEYTFLRCRIKQRLFINGC